VIRIKDFARQLDTAIITVEFDDYDGNLHEVSYEVPASALKDMTEDEIKAKVKDKVAVERMNLVEAELRKKIESLIGVDLEAE